MNFMKAFPHSRGRRLRQTPWVRKMVAEHRLHAYDLIQPIFITSGKTEAITAMPGIKRYSLDDAVEFARKVALHGVCAVALFPVVPTSLKTADGQRATQPDNLTNAFKLSFVTCPQYRSRKFIYYFLL